MSDIIIIEAGKSEKNYWRDLWKFRELFVFLTWRDIIVRYKQAAMGIAWAVIRPLLTMAVFTVVFSKVAKLPSEAGAPYSIMVFSALLPWQFFSQAFSSAANSFVSNSNLLTKVYFPRVIVPMTSVGVAFIDFLFSFIILVCMMIYYRYLPGIEIIAIPLFLIMTSIIALGTGLFIASLNVKYRDFVYIVPFMIQVGLYISPVGFSSSIVPEQWRLLYSLNPMVGVIDGFRWSILGNMEFPVNSIMMSCITGFIFLISGIWYFRKTERTFADNI